MDIELLSFDTLGKGAGREKFDDELAKVLSNIQDPNTNWKAKRKITLTVTFIPSNEERNQAKIEIDADSKLAKIKPFVSTLILGAINGRDAAREVVQDELFPQQKKDGKVLTMAAGQPPAPNKEEDEE